MTTPPARCRGPASTTSAGARLPVASARRRAAYTRRARATRSKTSHTSRHRHDGPRHGPSRHPSRKPDPAARSLPRRFGLNQLQFSRQVGRPTQRLEMRRPRQPGGPSARALSPRVLSGSRVPNHWKRSRTLTQEAFAITPGAKATSDGARPRATPTLKTHPRLRLAARNYIQPCDSVAQLWGQSSAAGGMRPARTPAALAYASAPGNCPASDL
jgi:hypothetical protein